MDGSDLLHANTVTTDWTRMSSQGAPSPTATRRHGPPPPPPPFPTMCTPRPRARRSRVRPRHPLRGRIVCHRVAPRARAGCVGPPRTADSNSGRRSSATLPTRLTGDHQLSGFGSKGGSVDIDVDFMTTGDGYVRGRAPRCSRLVPALAAQNGVHGAAHAGRRVQHAPVVCSPSKRPGWWRGVCLQHRTLRGGGWWAGCMNRPVAWSVKPPQLPPPPSPLRGRPPGPGTAAMQGARKRRSRATATWRLARARAATPNPSCSSRWPKRSTAPSMPRRGAWAWTG